MASWPPERHAASPGGDDSHYGLLISLRVEMAKAQKKSMRLISREAAEGRLTGGHARWTGLIGCVQAAGSGQQALPHCSTPRARVRAGSLLLGGRLLAGLEPWSIAVPVWQAAMWIPEGFLNIQKERAPQRCCCHIGTTREKRSTADRVRARACLSCWRQVGELLVVLDRRQDDVAWG